MYEDPESFPQSHLWFAEAELVDPFEVVDGLPLPRRHLDDGRVRLQLCLRRHEVDEVSGGEAFVSGKFVDLGRTVLKLSSARQKKQC